jgi:hypothetical protein
MQKQVAAWRSVFSRHSKIIAREDEAEEAEEEASVSEAEEEEEDAERRPSYVVKRKVRRKDASKKISRYNGVSWEPLTEKWRARVRDTVGQRDVYLGTFVSQQDAALAIKNFYEGTHQRVPAPPGGAGVGGGGRGFGGGAPAPRKRGTKKDAAAKTSRFEGVEWVKDAKRWRATHFKKPSNYHPDGKDIVMGYYRTQEGAAKAIKTYVATKVLPMRTVAGLGQHNLNPVAPKLERAAWGFNPCKHPVSTLHAPTKCANLVSSLCLSRTQLVSATPWCSASTRA